MKYTPERQDGHKKLELYTSSQIADVLGVTVGSILRWKKQNRIPYYESKGGHWLRFSLEEVLAALSSSSQKDINR